MNSNSSLAIPPIGGRLPFWGLYAFTFVLILAPQFRYPFLAPFRIAFLTAGAAVVGFVADRLLRGQPILGLTSEMVPAALLYGWAVVMTPFSYWPGGTASFLLNFYSKTLIVFWLLCKVVNTRSRLRRIAWGLSIMVLPLTYAAIVAYFSGSMLRGRISGYSAPLTGNPNDLALFLNLVLPLMVALGLTTKSYRLKLGLVVAIALLGSAIVITFSRSGFLTLATIVFLYAHKLRGKPARKVIWVGLLAALLFVPFLPEGYTKRLGTIVSVEADESGSSQERWGAMVAALKFVVRNPIVGSGAGMNHLGVGEMRGRESIDVHNVYLQLAVELGIPGLAFFLALIVRCIKATRRVQERTEHLPDLQDLYHLSGALEVSLIAFAVAALFYPTAYHFYFYYIAGLAVAVKSICESEQASVRSPRITRTWKTARPRSKLQAT